jgi:hypothetical protein
LTVETAATLTVGPGVIEVGTGVGGGVLNLGAAAVVSAGDGRPGVTGMGAAVELALGCAVGRLTTLGMPSVGVVSAVGTTGAALGTTGAAAGMTGATAGMAGATVRATGATVRATGAIVRATGATVRAAGATVGATEGMGPGPTTNPVGVFGASTCSSVGCS